MKLSDQVQYIKHIVNEFNKVGIPVSGMYMPSEDTDGGVEIDGKFILHYAPYHEPRLLLDRVESPGNEIASFETVDSAIKYFMEM